MSINLLEYKDKQHTLQDDLESFFWVLMYTCLRNFEHNRTQYVEDIGETVFEDCRWSRAENRYVGGLGKRSLVTSTLPDFKYFEIYGSEGLCVLFAAFRRAVKEYHNWVVDLEENLQEKFSSRGKSVNAGKAGRLAGGGGGNGNQKGNKSERTCQWHEEFLYAIATNKVPDTLALHHHDGIILLFDTALESDDLRLAQLAQGTLKRDRSESQSNDSITKRPKRSSQSKQPSSTRP